MISTFGHPAGAAPRHGRIWYWIRRRLSRLHPRASVVKRNAAIVVGLLCAGLIGKLAVTALEVSTLPKNPASIEDVKDSAAALPADEMANVPEPAAGTGALAREDAPGIKTQAPITEGRAMPSGLPRPAGKAFAERTTEAIQEEKAAREAKNSTDRSGETARRSSEAAALPRQRPAEHMTRRYREQRHVVRRVQPQPEQGSRYPQWGFAPQNWWRW